MYETYIGRTDGDHIDGFKTRITILQKVEVGYQCANSPFMSLIALKEIIDNQKNHSFIYTSCSL